MEQMYKGIPFSPTATLTANISATDTVIPVSDVDAFPDAPSIATIGTDTTAETIIYTAKTATALTGCTRGVEGTAKDWQTDEIIGRNFTAKDHADIIKNIENLDNNKLDATYKVDVVNTTDTSVAGKALDARQNNPNITGTLAKKIADNTQQINVLNEKNTPTLLASGVFGTGETITLSMPITNFARIVISYGDGGAECINHVGWNYPANLRTSETFKGVTTFGNYEINFTNDTTINVVSAGTKYFRKVYGYKI